MTTVLLADDHTLVRDGLRALLAMDPALSVVGEAADGLAAVEMAERLRPDVVLLDLMMPCLGGMGATRQVRKCAPESRVVILSMHADEAYVVEALRCGAHGYVLKESSAAELIRAVHDVAAGRRYLSPPLADRAIDAYGRAAGRGDVDGYERLTKREREVLNMAAQGSSNARIGERLGISPRTVEIHRANLMHKLGLKSQVDLLRFALKRGLLALHE